LKLNSQRTKIGAKEIVVKQIWRDPIAVSRGRDLLVQETFVVDTKVITDLRVGIKVAQVTPDVLVKIQVVAWYWRQPAKTLQINQ